MRTLRAAVLLLLAAAAPAAAHCHAQYQVTGPGGLFYDVGIGVFDYKGVLPGGTTTQLGAQTSWTDVRQLELYHTITFTLTATDLTGAVTCPSVDVNLDGPPPCTDDSVPEGLQPCTPSFTITQTGAHAFACASSCAAYPQPHVQPVTFLTPPADPAPALSSLAPGAVPGASAFALRVSGSGFVGASQVEWSGTPLATELVDGGSLLALVPPSMAAALGAATVDVLNPGGRSAAMSFPSTSTTTAAATPAWSARVYPNPWRASTGAAGVTFDRAPSGAVIKLFSLTGGLVRTLDAPGGAATWDLSNSAGQAAASGYYVYLITDGAGAKQIGRLALIR